tara:strand:- start:121 stop:1245 length:1125 start_codon:yes stop_codon:yes gene_type:complete
MAYNVLKGKVEGSVDQHADQEIGGVKVFKNTVSASVFWDTDAQSPCATLKDVAVTQIKGASRGGVLIYDSENTLRTNHKLVYKDDILNVANMKAEHYQGSAAGLYNLPTDKFDGEIDATFLNYSEGLQNVRGALQIKTTDCLKTNEDGIGISLEPESSLWIKGSKLTIDITKTERINSRGQNLSDDDLLIVSDVSTNKTNNTTLKNLYDNYINLKVPHASGPVGSLQIKGKSEFDSCSKLTYDTSESALKVEGRVKAKSLHSSKKLICEGSVYHNITKTSDSVYQVAENDYTILCDSSNNKVVVELPAPCNSEGRIVVIKKANSDRYKLNSNTVEICCEESKIDLSDSVVLKSNYSARTLQSDGESWLVINKIG